MICDCCKEFFEKGTGHLCKCPSCETIHPFCNECYISGKEKGNIIDKDIDIHEIDMKKEAELV